MSDCVFCQRIEADDYIGADRGCVYFEPLNPVTPGHMLFLPRAHLANASVAPWAAGLAFEEAARYGHSRGAPFNLITSVGADATQTVWHLHVHYVPRRTGDGLHLPWTQAPS